jgi:hypothetical protein
VNALSETYYSRYARARRSEAQRVLDQHVVCAYTGVCLACGRPGPCAERADAERTLARRDHLNGPVSTAIRTANGTIEPLRTACLAAQEAVDRATRQVGGIEHDLPRIGLTSWDSALTFAWQSLTMVYAGLAEARQLPGSEPSRVVDVLTGLAGARLDANRATLEVDRVRRQLTVAEDALRRADADPRALAAAERWARATARLDLVAARLAIGARALDGYAAALTGAPDPVGTTAGVRLTRLLTRVRPPATEIRRGTTAAGLLVLRVYPWSGWRGFMARWRREAWKEFKRSWIR